MILKKILLLKQKIHRQETSKKKRLFKFSPKISTTHYGFATDISPIVAYDDRNGTVAFKLEIDTYRKLNEHWSTYGTIYFDFAGTKDNKSGEDSYSNDVFEGNIDKDNKFALSVEQYLNYERQIVGELYFSTELALEAYSILQSDSNDIALYAEPKIQYRAKINTWSVVPYIAYTAYTATGGYESGKGGEVSRDELSIGVSFGTKF